MWKKVGGVSGSWAVEVGLAGNSGMAERRAWTSNDAHEHLRRSPLSKVYKTVVMYTKTFILIYKILIYYRIISRYSNQCMSM